MTKVRTSTCLWIALFAWSAQSVAFDHPLHSARATVEYNLETGSFEVSLCVFPDDLSLVLSERAKRRIDVEKDGSLDDVLKTYVSEKFQLSVDSAKPEALNWVGHESQTHQFWLYFEFPVDSESPQEISIKNTLLMEQFDDQLNVAYVRIGGRQRCLTFRTDTPDWQHWKLSRAGAEMGSRTEPAISQAVDHN